MTMRPDRFFSFCVVVSGFNFLPYHKNCIYTVSPEFCMINKEPSGAIEMLIQPGESK